MNVLVPYTLYGFFGANPYIKRKEEISCHPN